MAKIEDGPAGNANRPLDLTGDSPEIVAFGLLRYLAQIEQQEARQSGIPRLFDRKWMLDAYAECLEAAKGQRVLGKESAAPTATASGRASKAK